jgi:hypothetical protein
LESIKEEKKKLVNDLKMNEEIEEQEMKNITN